MNRKALVTLEDDKYEKDCTNKYVLTKEDVDDVVSKMIAVKSEIDAKTVYLQIDSKIVVVANYGCIVNLESISVNSQRRIIKLFIKRIFDNSEIMTIDAIRIKTSHSGLNKLTNAIKRNHYGILLHSDYLVQTAEYVYALPDDCGRNIEYRYYRAYLSFDNRTVYSMQLNIRVDHMGAVLYDINKIKKSGWTIRLGKSGTL